MSITEAELNELRARQAAGEAVPELEPAPVTHMAAVPELTPEYMAAHGMVERLKLVRWLIENAPDIGKLVALGQLLLEAKTLEERWDIAKQIGDELVPFIGSLPEQFGVNGAFTASCVYVDLEHESEAELEALAQHEAMVAAGLGLKDLLPVVMEVLPILLELLRKYRS